MRKYRKNYKDTVNLTFKSLGSCIDAYMQKVAASNSMSIEHLNSIWYKFAGEHVRNMSKVVSFDNGILIIAAFNSTLLSILASQESCAIEEYFKEKLAPVQCKKIVYKLSSS